MDSAALPVRALYSEHELSSPWRTQVKRRNSRLGGGPSGSSAQPECKAHSSKGNPRNLILETKGTRKAPGCNAVDRAPIAESCFNLSCQIPSEIHTPNQPASECARLAAMLHSVSRPTEIGVKAHYSPSHARIGRINLDLDEFLVLSDDIPAFLARVRFLHLFISRGS